MKEFVEATNKETGAVYYGWTRQGDTLFCREAYTDAAGALAHLDNVGSLVGKMLEAAASLDKIELHGPEAELEKCKEKMDGFGTTCEPRAKLERVDSSFALHTIASTDNSRSAELCVLLPCCCAVARAVARAAVLLL